MKTYGDCQTYDRHGASFDRGRDWLRDKRLHRLNDRKLLVAGDLRVKSGLIFALLLALTALTAFAPAAWAQSSRPVAPKVRAQYEELLAKLDAGDEAGFLRLAQWCRVNGMNDEAQANFQRSQEIALRLKRAELDKNPTAAGFRALISWCETRRLTGATAELRRGLALLEYGEKRGKLTLADAAGFASLADWCAKNGLAEQAAESWKTVLAAAPEDPRARAELGYVKFDGAWLTEPELARRYLALPENQRDEFVAQALKGGGKWTKENWERWRTWAQAPTGLIKNQKVTGRTEADAWYHVSVPANYDAFKEPLPLIVFLHGGGSSKGSPDMITALAKLLPSLKEAVVLFPNHLKGKWSWGNAEQMICLLSAMEDVMNRWRVDGRRLYLLGVSMGGNGVWSFGSRCPELFAAFAPVSSAWGPYFEFPMENLRDKPVYVLHGSKDGTVPVADARRAYDCLKSLGSTKAELHVVEAGHQVSNDELEKAVAWLLQHRNDRTFNLDELKKRAATVKPPQRCLGM